MSPEHAKDTYEKPLTQDKQGSLICLSKLKKKYLSSWEKWIYLLEKNMVKLETFKLAVSTGSYYKLKRNFNVGQG